MANVNKVTLIGTLVRDLEVRYTKKETAVASTAIAVNRKYGENEQTTFIDLTLWDKVAETVAKHLGKGDPIYIEGRLESEEWEDKETGAKRSKLKVTVENFQFLGKGKSEGGSSGGNSKPAPKQNASPAPSFDDEDDIPF